MTQSTKLVGGGCFKFVSKRGRGLLARSLGLVFLVLGALILSGCQQQMTGVLNPKGLVAYQERQLLFDAVALMLIVVIPVVIMSFAFVFRYRASHEKGQYKPNWCHNPLLELLWWGVPCVIIVILGILTWRSTHQLDPYRSLDVPGETMQVEVVALPWKWLFIYPKQNIATVNYLQIPKGQQVEFLLTSDNVPMSAFFIPQLGSQIYTMAGMRTRLHLVANHEGTFEGLNSQYNGAGFSEMHFDVKVVDPKEMDQWYRKVKQSSKKLMTAEYGQLIKPKIDAPVEYFSAVKPDLFKDIMKSYRSARKESVVSPALHLHTEQVADGAS